MNFPTEVAGRRLENYIDWIAPAFLVTLVGLPAGSVPAGKTADGLAGRSADRRAAVRGAADPLGREARAAGEPDRLAAL